LKNNRKVVCRKITYLSDNLVGSDLRRPSLVVAPG